MARRETSVYRHVVTITHSYLGPAAERFIARQARNHLDKEPETLTEQDLIRLIDWIRVAVSLLTDDSDIVEEYISQLQHLTRKAQKV